MKFARLNYYFLFNFPSIAMDPVLLLIFAAAALVLLILFINHARRAHKDKDDGDAPGGERPPRNLPPAPVAAADRPRHVPRRNIRQRMRQQQQDEDSNEEEGDFDDGEVMRDAEGKKMGAKKMEKLRLKEEKRQQRQAEIEEREERKKKEEELERKRKLRDQLEKQDEEMKLEEERKAKEEQERRDHEEYLLLKKAFEVEEEGFDESQNIDESQDLLRDFINHVKEKKVVMLDDLASHFKMKTQDVVQRLETLQAEGELTGVMDDRGKFIYITRAELEAVAKFIKQRGRVSIADLVDSSNNLINLAPPARAAST